MKRSLFILLFFIPFFISACGAPTSPLAELKQTLAGVPTYSIILSDMKEEGNFSASYFHKYRVLIDDKVAETDWKPVSKKEYENLQPFLGMTIQSKVDGVESGTAGPPGYEYVGNPNYGTWQRDSSGNSFWAFYGQYRLISDLLGGGRIYRNDWNTYSDYRSRNRPYYGANKQYGTDGSFTKVRKPDFYSRRMNRQSAKSASFSDRVQQRVGRTRTSSRGRSFGFGK